MSEIVSMEIARIFQKKSKTQFGFLKCYEQKFMCTYICILQVCIFSLQKVNKIYHCVSCKYKVFHMKKDHIYRIHLYIYRLYFKVFLKLHGLHLSRASTPIALRTWPSSPFVGSHSRHRAATLVLVKDALVMFKFHCLFDCGWLTFVLNQGLDYPTGAAY
jgi:hypothetical protein